MTRFIKIFTIMTGLTLMTACGASSLLDDVRDFLAEQRAARTAEIRENLLDQRLIEERLAAFPEAQRTVAKRAEIAEDVAGLTLEQIEAELDLTQDELADINAEAERTALYSEAVAGLNKEQIEARLRTCRGTPNVEGCAGVLTNFCYDTPFDRACDATTHATRRVEYIAECDIGTETECIDHAGAACRANSSITGCGAFVTRVCDADPTYTACDGNADYFLAQDNACWIQGRNGGTRTDRCQQIVDTNRLVANAGPSCRANFVVQTNENGNNTRCFNAVIAVCDLNPFDSFCGHNTNYGHLHPAYILACTNQVPNARFCAEAKAFVCNTNPFDALCSLDYTTNDYASERQTAISDCQTTFVAGKRCDGAAVEFCGDATGEGLFSALCLNDPNTDAGRQPICVRERVAVVEVGDNPISARCTGTATRLCDANPLDPLCEDVTAYRARQFSACVVAPTHSSCAVGTAQFSYITPIIECLSNPFGADCVNPATEAGIAFAANLEAAQDSYCEGGATTKTATPDHVNCTNIGSLPDYPELASEYEFVTVNYMGNKIENGGYVRDDEGEFVQEAKTRKAALGGFLKTGVYGTGLGVYTGKARVVRTHPLPAIPATFDENTGNFDRASNTGGLWVNLPVDTTEGLPAGYPTNYSVDPNTFTRAPAGTTPNDGFIQTQRIYEFASPVDSKDGFIFFVAFISDERGSLDALPRSVSSYAGIQATSNFGAPLAAPVGDAPTTAIWAGQFTAHVSDRLRLNAHPTDFYVDFANGTFNIHNPDGTDGANPNGTAPKTGSITAVSRSGGDGDQGYDAGTFVYTVDGRFGVDKDDPNVSYTNGGVARKLNPGELSGEVTLVSSQFSAKNVLDVKVAVNPQTIEMPLTGLIGVEGAVGVFLDPNPGTSAVVGGFTAAPRPTN